MTTDHPEGDTMSETSETYHGDRVVAWADGGPVTQSQHDEHSGGTKSTVEQPGVELLGEPSASAVAAASSPPAGDVSEVPANAADVVAWIKDGAEQSDEEAARRAGLAWTVESQRDGGVRTTVEAAVDEHLVPADGDSDEPVDADGESDEGENAPA